MLGFQGVVPFPQLFTALNHGHRRHEYPWLPRGAEHLEAFGLAGLAHLEDS